MIIANLDSSFALKSCSELDFPPSSTLSSLKRQTPIHCQAALTRSAKYFPKLCQNVEEEDDDNDDETP